MTGDEMIDCLSVLGWSERELAWRLGVNRMRVHRWSTGEYPVPEEVGNYLRSLARLYEAIEAPNLA